MTTRRLVVAAIGAMLCGLVQVLAQGTSLEGDLQRAKQREVTDGCKTVLADYTRIADQGAKSNRPIAAEALLREAMCHELLRDGLAGDRYAQVANEFKEQREFARQATVHLNALATGGSTTKALTKASPPARFVSSTNGLPSPDGKRLVFAQDADVVVRTLATGAVTKVVVHTEDAGVCVDEPMSLAWSRDGAQIAFVWCHHPGGTAAQRSNLAQGNVDGWGGRDVRIAAAAGGSPKVVLAQGAEIGVQQLRLEDWSPDRMTLAAVRIGDPDDELLLVPTTAKAPRVLATAAGFSTVRFTSDGKAIIYNQRGGGANRVVYQPIDGVASDVFGDASGNQFVGLTPNDGLFFLSARSGTFDLGLVHLADGRVSDLPVWPRRDIGPVDCRAITSDGTLYDWRGAGTIYGNTTRNLADVYLVATSPESGRVLSEPAPVSQRPGHTVRPIWSRDGRLAYKSGPGGTILPVISILTVETGAERVLETRVTSPRFDWSPDGRFFLQGRLLQLVDVETGQRTPIREPVKGEPALGGELFKFFPDGRAVTYRTAQNRLMYVDLTTKEVRSLVTLQDDESVASYAFAPDGHAMVMIVHDWTKKARDIRVMTLADGKIRSLIGVDASRGPDDGATWSHDSRYVVYADETAAAVVPGTAQKRTELWRIPETGGRPENLGLTFDGIRQIAIAPDGRHLAFTFEPELRAGLWALDNVVPASERLRK